ncbi:hypothetical protein L566_0089 [Bordetella pertussis CHLA-26]|uniref:Uncharacterized protein n=1 Tax=Bordetella pertussis CHLA-26 TaxID=1331284 RepID=A0AAI9J3H8_BORPT|nr:hypothetical protein L566_0089 [Bordetella pertussis CHLA-26]
MSMTMVALHGAPAIPGLDVRPTSTAGLRPATRRAIVRAAAEIGAKMQEAAHA